MAEFLSNGVNLAFEMDARTIAHLCVTHRDTSRAFRHKGYFVLKRMSPISTNNFVGNKK